MKILDKIDSPADVRKLSIADQKKLADELREELLQDVAKKGGHLSSNLGVVELTIAIHTVFNTPIDKIIFDVGHQTYVHKILTGRKDQMDTLRELDGLSGFPKRRESEYDVFDTGHSSTSISAALGLARARDLRHEKNRIVAVIGDGSMTAGMAFEALADAASSKTDIIVILNDNEMSIEKTDGGLAQALSKARTKPLYTNSNRIIKKFVLKIPYIGEWIVKVVRRIKHTLKQLFIPNMLFEDMGFTYLGPVDGHDLDKLESMLYRARDLKGPVLIHCLTKKGKGYKPAEENPDLYHGVSPFDLDKGVVKSKSDDYSSIFGKKLAELAATNDKIVAITAAMTSGTGLTYFKEKFPERFFDVQIAEQHALTMASGLAVGGMIPVVAIYSSFLQRAYDQLIHDIALQGTHVVICLDRAGLVGKDGETHNGLYDLGFLKVVPDITILAPKDYQELEDMLKVAIEDLDGPVVIRYPRGQEAYHFDIKDQTKRLKAKKAEIINKGSDILIIAIGKMVARAKEVADKLKVDHNIDPSIINVSYLKPFDEKTILALIQSHDMIVTIEDETLVGGLKDTVDQSLVQNKITKKVLHFGYPDAFIAQGDTKDVERRYGLDTESIESEIFKSFQS